MEPMEIANTYLRGSDPRSFSPYFFYPGDCTPAEESVIKTALAPHVPARVPALFNTWYFGKLFGRFYALRDSWFSENRMWGETVEELIQKIKAYYGAE